MAARGAEGAEGGDEFEGLEGAVGFEGAEGAVGFEGGDESEELEGAVGFEGAVGLVGAVGFEGGDESEELEGAVGFERAGAAAWFKGAVGSESAEEFEKSEGFEGADTTTESEGADTTTESEGPEQAEAEAKRRQEDFEKKLIRVTLWLKKIYGDWPIPTYEVNERTVDILHGLMELNEARDRDISLVIEEMKDQEARYDAETKEMQDILQHDLGLSIHSLSRKARKCHKDLVKSAMAVDAKDTSLTSLFCAINDMTWELYDTEYKNRIMARKVNTLKKKMAAVLAMEKRVQEDIEKVEEQQQAERIKIESRSRNLKFLRDKNLELNIRIRNAQEELISRGMDRSLTHNALVQLYQEVVPLQEKVASLKKKLKNFYDLPPSIPLARVKIEEERRKLKALQEELSKELDKMAFELT